jgi:hypothetical protein
VRSRIFLRLGALALGLAFAAAFTGCRRSEPLCDFCRMPVPARTAASVDVAGVRHRVCDPRCALTHQRQTGVGTTLVAVTDFDTGRPLAPERAVYLSGSDTAPDVGRESLRKPADAVYREWHRCLPSVLAFADRGAAERFRARHGGVIRTLGELGYANASRAPGR